MTSPSGPEIAVVVSTRNRRAQLAELLDTLDAQTLEPGRFEVVVVDDGSTDGTAALLDERRGPHLATIRHDRPHGPAAGREAGWRASAAPLIAFTDDDCIARADWLERALAATAARPGAIVQGTTLPRSDQLDRIGPLARTMSVTGYDPNFPTTNLIVPRAVLEDIDGFDAESFEGMVGGEDTDLVWRAIGAGVEVAFDPKPIVEHAVNVLGLSGWLRVAWRWSAVIPFARHPELRRQSFIAGRFRKRTHAELALAIAALVLQRLPAPVRLLLLVPWARSLRARVIIAGADPGAAAAYAAYDLVETAATIRGGIRERCLMI